MLSPGMGQMMAVQKSIEELISAGLSLQGMPLGHEFCMCHNDAPPVTAIKIHQNDYPDFLTL